MIIVKDRPGQLCNRIWAYAPFIDFAISNDVKLVIIGFSDYEHLFENLNRFPNVRVLKESDHRAYRFYTKLISLASKFPESLLGFIGIHYHKNSYSHLLRKKRRLIFIDSWGHEKPQVELDRSILSELFKPKKTAQQKVEDFVLDKRKDYDLLVGIHIRRGDYKDYKDGIYYYSDNQYAHLMQQIEVQNPDKKIGFILCSNTATDLDKYRPLEVFRLEDAGMIEDLQALSQCDYILGPPSTYSMWASFVGEAPLYLVKDPNTPISLAMFSRITSQNKFESGEVFSH
ncbi:MAG: hypothetical protein HKO93_03735 [Flavobacteriales bacterium]|nr:hypothetical protein [Flavobacteriales bacterium]